MKKIIIILSFLIPVLSIAQKHNIVNASLALKNANKADDDEIKLILKEAKSYIDEAYNTESTSNEPKMWNYRAPIYLKIALKSPELDPMAIFKATESHIKCLQIKDPNKKRPKIIVSKWTPKEDVLAGLIQCGYKLFTDAVAEYNTSNYARAIKLYETIFDIFPYDEEDQLKRGNITKETVLYNSFFAARKMKDNIKSKKILQQLIDINFNEPAIYVHLSKIYIEEGDDEKALEIINYGRDMFDDDQGLINEEINLYIKLNRTEELLDKLSIALEDDPENEVLLEIRGTVYYNSDDFKSSEKDFRKILEFDPNHFNANSIIGSILVNDANVIIDKANNTNDNQLYEKLRKNAKNTLNMALPYLEAAFKANPENKSNIELLKQVYYKVGDYKKSEEMKQKLADLK